MAADAKLLALFTVVHAIGLGLVGLLFAMLFRSDVHRRPSRSDDGEGGGGGGGGSDRTPPRAPPAPGGGGIPLPDAEPASVRLRAPGRLADLRPRPERRPAREPERPPRPAPTTSGRTARRRSAG